MRLVLLPLVDTPFSAPARRGRESQEQLSVGDAEGVNNEHILKDVDVAGEVVAANGGHNVLNKKKNNQ